MSTLTKVVRVATAAVKDDLSQGFQAGAMVAVIYTLASRIERASGSPKFTADESNALTALLDAWRVAEPAAVPA